ncbi:hypothetical protein [Streptomyces sp. NPDC052701]|uniref:hypothetical protein n=1 Tax=Streptomyces sp. NPDC052701 TaxID=3155533 RepID=UPI00342273C1
MAGTADAATAGTAHAAAEAPAAVRSRPRQLDRAAHRQQDGRGSPAGPVEPGDQEAERRAGRDHRRRLGARAAAAGTARSRSGAREPPGAGAVTGQRRAGRVRPPL